MTRQNPWGPRLAALRQGDPTVSQVQAINEAAEWDSCAVGFELGLKYGEGPQDEELRTLGDLFSHQINYARYAAAEKTLAKITAAAADPDRRGIITT